MVSLLLCSCTSDPIINNANPGQSNLTILKFNDKTQEKYLVAGHPIITYSSMALDNTFTYEEDTISFMYNPYFQFSSYADFVNFAEKELNICGTSPYIELVGGYVLIDWRWNYFYHITLISQKEWYSQRVIDLVQHHTFVTNILWSDLNDLSPRYWTDNQSAQHIDLSSVNMIPIRLLDQLRGISKNPPYPDEYFSGDYSNHLYWDGLSVTLAYCYYRDHSPKYEAYLAFCDSMQNIYKHRLIEHIKKQELSNISIK
jgi:hypothetical protein